MFSSNSVWETITRICWEIPNTRDIGPLESLLYARSKLCSPMHPVKESSDFVRTQFSEICRVVPNIGRVDPQ
jgi:hypothetical protein